MSDTQILDELASIRQAQEEHVRANTDQHERLFVRVEEQGREMTRLAAVTEAESDKCTQERAQLRRIIVGNGAAGHDERLRNVESAIGVGKKLIWVVTIGSLGVLGSLVWSVIQWALEQGAGG